MVSLSNHGGGHAGVATTSSFDRLRMRSTEVFGLRQALRPSPEPQQHSYPISANALAVCRATRAALSCFGQVAQRRSGSIR